MTITHTQPLPTTKTLSTEPKLREMFTIGESMFLFFLILQLIDFESESVNTNKNHNHMFENFQYTMCVNTL